MFFVLFETSHFESFEVRVDWLKKTWLADHSPKFWDILKFPSSISFQHFFAAKRNLRWSNDVRCCQPFWVVRIEILEPTKAQLSKAFGGFKYFLFSPLLGEMIQFDEHIFQIG